MRVQAYAIGKNIPKIIETDLSGKNSEKAQTNSERKHEDTKVVKTQGWFLGNHTTNGQPQIITNIGSTKLISFMPSDKKAIS